MTDFFNFKAMCNCVLYASHATLYVNLPNDYGILF